MSLFEELRRRNVFRVAIAYVLLGWAVLQGADFLLDLIGAPEWVIRALAIIGLVGLPFALIFAWAFELTPEGVKRERDVDRSQSITRKTGKKLNGVIIGLLLVIIVLMGVERVFFAGSEAPTRLGADAEAPKSIAVLPFEDLSQAQDQGWFADGLAEEILNALVRVPDLRVAARTSSFAYKGQSKQISDIAAELGVAHVLEGSVRSAGDRIRVTAQLIRASDGFHLWSQNYDRDMADMIGIQEDLAQNIATALETSMDPEALANMARVGTSSVEAYQEYLRGLQALNLAWTSQINPEAARESYESIERARALDPGFFEAHVQAALYWKVELTPSRTDSGSSGLKPQQMLGEYNERIGDAIRTARNEADRLRSMADRAMVELRLRDARRLFLEYLQHRPNDMSASFELAGVLGMLSDRANYRYVLEDWRERGKSDPMVANYYANEAYRMIDPSRAADFGLEAIERWPNSSAILYQVHRTLLWAGRNREATELAARYEVLVPGGDPLVRAREACAAGDRAAAEVILETIEERRRKDELSVRWLLNNMLGNTEQEIETLRPLEVSGVPFQLATFLSYNQFDARPYPSLMAVLQREGVQRPPPQQPPFRCPPSLEPSVAVLPFDNMSADPDQEYFSDGITEEIINALVGVPGVKVAARTSVFAFKGRNEDIRAIGKELGVTHVVEGSVRSDGEQLRITAQLIQAADGFHVWSETFDRQRVNVFAIQEDIASAIARVLNEQLGEPPAVPEVARISVKAYDDYLRGRALLRERNDEGLVQARKLFESVTAAHPDYAPGWSALAITADVLDDEGPAEQYALRALELEPDNVDALTALGAVYRDTRRWAQAEEQFKRAMALDPDSAELLEDYGEFLARTGRTQALLEVTSRGFAVDPYLAPLVEVYTIGLLSSGEAARAIEVLETVIQRRDWEWLNGVLASAYIQKGDQAALRRLVSEVSIPQTHRDALLRALDEPGDPDAAAGVEALYRSEEGRSPAASFHLAENVLLLIGRVGPVIDVYTRQITDYEILQSDAWILPAYAVFRGDPRFPELLEESGLPDYWDQAGWPDFCRREGAAISCQ